MPTKRPVSPVRCLAFLAVLLAAVLPCVAQQQDTAIEKFASLLGEAIKAVTGAPEKRPAAPVAVEMVEEVAFGPARADKDVKQRLKRLQLHAAVMQDWISSNTDLSADQKQQLTKSSATAIEQEQTSWKNKPAQNQRNQWNQSAFHDFFPICFTDTTGPARGLERASVGLATKKSTEKNSSRLSEAVTERQQFRYDAALEYALNLIDDELFITARQREELSELVAKNVNLNAACFTFQPLEMYGTYFSETAVGKALPESKVAGILTESQKQLAIDMASPNTSAMNSSRYIMLNTGDDDETLRDKLKESGVVQRPRLSRMLAVRIDFFKAAYGLTDQQVRRLQVAGKGAIDEVIANWKDKTSTTMKRYRDRNQFGGRATQIGMSVPQVRELVGNKLWKENVEVATSGDSEALAARNKTRREAKAKFVVAMLDRELWLDPFQRKRLIDSVTELIPDSTDTTYHQPHLDELSLLVQALFKLSNIELTILSPAQRNVWKAMKEPFQINGSYVQVQTENRGTVSVRLPK